MYLDLKNKQDKIMQEINSMEEYSSLFSADEKKKEEDQKDSNFILFPKPTNNFVTFRRIKEFTNASSSRCSLEIRICATCSPIFLHKNVCRAYDIFFQNTNMRKKSHDSQQLS